ncbi:MAG: hypothetical protein IAE79_12380 [Anaerolinea sp.]|nr:hypothetical protein [Anaerolinea sp.]
MRQRQWAQRPFPSFFLLALWCTAVTLILYGASLTLPFFFDDLVQLPYAQAHSYAELWTRAQLAYYRPLNFHLWKLFYDIFDAHNRLVNHGLNLLLHAANGWLVGWLAWKLWSGRQPARHLRPFLSATLFLFFPFSYQGVPWVGALNHVLAIFLILLSLASYVLWRQNGRRRWLLTGLLMALLAPFAHENGILTGPLLALILCTGGDWRSRQGETPPTEAAPKPFASFAPLRFPLLWTLPGLAWLVIWRLVPQAESAGLFWNGWEGIWQSSVYFSQGVAYPLAWAGKWVQARLAVSDMTAVSLLTSLALLITLPLQSRNRRAALPWAWIVLTLLPAILFLRFDYVINGPRLLLLASVGIAWLWADVFVTIAQKRWWRQVLAVLLVAALLWQNGRFIHTQMQYHRILGRAFDEAIAVTTAANASGETAVLLNFPSWLAPTATYAIGHEGVLFWPDYVPHRELTTVHTGQPADLVFARVDAIRPQMPYFYGVTGSTPDWQALRGQPTAVFVTTYTETAVTLHPAGQLGHPASPGAPLATFIHNDQPALILLSATHAPRPTPDLVLTWQLTAPLPTHTVFIHLLDANGQLIAQADGDPLAGSYPFAIWQPGEVVLDARRATAVGAVQVLVGVYDWTTGERLTAVVPGTAVHFADNAVPIALTKE